MDVLLCGSRRDFRKNGKSSTSKLLTSSATMLLGIVIGCGSQDSAPKTSLFADDHTVAEHWPEDLPDAAAKLRERLALSEINKLTRKEIDDLVGWTAEIAADTNLSEADWLPLHHATQSLMTKLRATEDGLNRDEASQIEALCQLIDDAVRRIPEHPPSLKVTSP
ncbi:hypothetical protein Q31b_09740 [Novipirellula aureliae]|uniref:Uncharacterized protein n=1 Tax=Novipirellula aureliae TaxID=2527966 RepID=A0A5C6EAC1_9BACT|nr:hypothetical protein [Novipirellula aureliae]TWU45798.1 hypothetical protein Q31b_09740 [Novipirellula aureliae]